MKRDDILEKLLDHDVIRSKYEINDIPNSFHKAASSKHLIVKTLAMVVDEMEKPEADRASDNGLYEKVKQFLNVNS